LEPDVAFERQKYGRQQSGRQGWSAVMFGSDVRQ